MPFLFVSMERLLKIGFKSVGHWFLNEGELAYNLEVSPVRNFIYCFIAHNQVQYVGTTTGRLSNEMERFCNPNINMSRYIRVHNDLILEVGDGVTVDILALADFDMLTLGGFHLCLPAGLKDSLTEAYRPLWNLRLSQRLPDDERLEEPVVFRIPVVSEYFNHGFIFIPPEHAETVGVDLTEVTVLFEGYEHNGYIHRNPVLGTIRLMVGKDLREWIRDEFTVESEINVRIVSERLIELY